MITVRDYKNMSGLITRPLVPGAILTRADLTAYAVERLSDGKYLYVTLSAMTEAQIIQAMTLFTESIAEGDYDLTASFERENAVICAIDLVSAMKKARVG